MVELNDFIRSWGTFFGVGSLIVFMTFIIWDLAKSSNAGRFGTFVLATALGLGMFGFLIKGVLKVIIESNQV